MKKYCLIFLLCLLLGSNLFAQQQDQTTPHKSSIAVGFITGGALVGVEYEYLFFGPLAVTGGAGLLGFNGGLNYHFSEDINSHFIHLGAVNNGAISGAVSRYIECSANFRGFGWLQGSIGVGYNFYVSDELNESYNDLMGEDMPEWMLTYSLSWYTTF